MEEFLRVTLRGENLSKNALKFVFKITISVFKLPFLKLQNYRRNLQDYSAPTYSCCGIILGDTMPGSFPNHRSYHD
jgi:hypothetical protein